MYSIYEVRERVMRLVGSCDDCRYTMARVSLGWGVQLLHPGLETGASKGPRHTQTLSPVITRTQRRNPLPPRAVRV